MDTRVSWFGGVLSMATCATLAHGAVPFQDEPSGATPTSQEERESRPKVALEGFVLAPDGSPAENCVVVSSAGGKALTDFAGRYRLEVHAPREATSLELTAAGDAGGVARASVALSAATPTTHMAPL